MWKKGDFNVTSIKNLSTLSWYWENINIIILTFRAWINSNEKNSDAITRGSFCAMRNWNPHTVIYGRVLLLRLGYLQWALAYDVLVGKASAIMSLLYKRVSIYSRLTAIHQSHQALVCSHGIPHKFSVAPPGIDLVRQDSWFCCCLDKVQQPLLRHGPALSSMARPYQYTNRIDNWRITNDLSCKRKTGRLYCASISRLQRKLKTSSEPDASTNKSFWQRREMEVRSTLMKKVKLSG